MAQSASMPASLSARSLPTLARAEPLSELNTTPLIDVLLVLLVMFIITIPAATHSLDVDLPGWADDLPTLQIDPVRNRIDLAPSGAALWNGTPVNDAALRRALADSLLLPVEPELHFAAAPAAAYGRAAEVIALIKRSGVTKFGFVGNDMHKDFAAAP